MIKGTTFYFNVAVTIPGTTLMAESKAAAVDGDIVRDFQIARCLFEEQLTPGQAEIEIIECTEMVESEDPYQPEL